MLSADDAEYPREYRTLGGGGSGGSGGRRFSNVGLVHTSERRHTVIAAQSLEALSGLQKADADRKRDAFMDHLKSKYPQHALALRGQQDRMREQVSGSPAASRGLGAMARWRGSRSDPGLLCPQAHSDSERRLGQRRGDGGVGQFPWLAFSGTWGGRRWRLSFQTFACSPGIWSTGLGRESPASETRAVGLGRGARKHVWEAKGVLGRKRGCLRD